MSILRRSTTPPCLPNSTLRAGRNAAAGKSGDPRACTGDVLVVRRSWRDVFKNGVADHKSRSCAASMFRVPCYGILRQPALDQGGKSGLKEDDYSDLINFEASTRYTTPGGRAGLRRAITWDPPCRRRTLGAPGEALQRAGTGRNRLFRRHYDGSTALAPNAEHRASPVMAGTDGSMAPGFETEEALKRSKQAADYWAKINAKPSGQAAE